MKAADFDLSRDLVFDLSKGMTIFKDTRLLIFDANAIGLLRQNLIVALGIEKARAFFLRFGFQNGYSDFMQMKLNYTFDSEMDLLASGPVIHTYEGIVKATPTAVDIDRASGRFLFQGTWENSYEAEQHLSYNGPSHEPVCWSLMGYATGWSTAFFGKPLLAIEPVCVGKGDDHCEFLIQSPEKWGATATPYLAAYDEILAKLKK